MIPASSLKSPPAVQVFPTEAPDIIHPYCALCKFLTHSIQAHNKMPVGLHHYFGVVLLGSDAWNPPSSALV